MKRLFILTGLLLLTGALFNRTIAQNRENQVREQSIKYQRLMAYIDAFYVDTVNLQKLTEDAIIKALSDLDPHSVYITKEEVDEMNEPLEGGFFGIGIQFTILRDTLAVVAIVPGGPSEKAGLMAGDRIVSVDGENIAGKKLSNTEVRKRLKGEEGTIVKVGVLRGHENMDFRIIRGKIPIYSIDATYMLDKTTGYIKLSRFAATTIDEFEEAVKKLQAQGMKDLILDLQTNGGGYMGAAIGIADHLLDGRKMIVYTGVLVGRRSFGKGLVQRQFPLTDGSMVRLTIAHYYTPSGRCIQKPYSKGEEDYEAELYNRYRSGEMVSADSIVVNDSLKYFTKVKQRPVYGGGGIIPDVFVPLDTTISYLYFNRLIAKNVIGEFIANYIDKNRDQLKKKYPDFDSFVKNFQVTDAMIDEIVKAGEKADIPRDDKALKPLLPTIKLQLKALIARDLWNMNEMYQIMNEENDMLKKGLEVLKDGTYEKILGK